MAAGASPLFPPAHPDAAAAKQAILHLITRDPWQCGVAGTRWTRAAMQQTCDWLRDVTVGGIHHILDHLGVAWTWARSSVRILDPADWAKLTGVHAVRMLARHAPGTIVTVSRAEVTLERQPTLAHAYAEQGPDQARGQRSHSRHTLTRVVGTLDACTARVGYRRARKMTLPILVPFYQDLRAADPAAERISVIRDNWPVQTHPDVLVAREPQETCRPWHRPGNWPTQPRKRAQERWGDRHLPIQIVPLPTDAARTNPIETRWRTLQQAVIHRHRWADDLTQRRNQIDSVLDQFAHGSLALRRYVGLCPD